MRLAMGIAFLAAGLLSGCSSVPTASTLQGEVSFEAVRPILEHRCVRCHSDRHASGGLNFQDREGVLEGRRATATGSRLYRFVHPGSPEASLVYRAIAKPGTHPRMMPNDGWKLSRRQLRNLHGWIAQGAHWPEGAAGKLEEKRLIVEFDEAP